MMKRDAGVVCHRRGPLDVQGVQRGVADGLGVHGFGPVGDRVAQGVKVRGVDELDVYADLGQGVVELVVGAAVELRGRDDLISSPHDVQDRQRLGRLARGGRERADALLQRGYALLEDVGGGVHDPCVNVALFGEREQVRRPLGIVEDVGGGLVDGTARAVVVGSTSCPACNARVSNP